MSVSRKGVTGVTMNADNLRKRGDRVCLVMVNDVTGEERQRPGTVERDELEGWDYIDVKFDDFPMVQPVLCYYLHDVTEAAANDQR